MVCKKKLINYFKDKNNNEINSNIDGEELASKKFNIEVKGKIKIYMNKELINFVKGGK